MKLREHIFQAMRADAIPEGASGPWSVCKWSIAKSLVAPRGTGRSVTIPPGSYTNLFCLTEATMHQPPGELVMHDEPHELAKHLQFILKAEGRVLKTGLGLGCVVRGLLLNPRVTEVVVLERDQHVLKLVAPHMLKERLKIVHAEAVAWCQETSERFDCAWHDIWTDESAGEGHLAFAHQKLLKAMKGKVRFQGAWEFPREFRRLLQPVGVI